ncbi:tetratricopeptide repeat protein [Paenibacillus riograndensis]|uniref:Tetratricopeptide TPR_1 repeat-containing protein n=2 Tax=Paenibacillus riograndensis TaxID=483937 RepID=A0A0E4CWM3_9BACL|nr:tetratricopeptide repeat protein [Paenibacillus riograndensis]CQR55417.1 Tetratricopeptide TPR_1 repeat-containing protein [Paenibacillus riograndensis SBR5]
MLKFFGFLLLYRLVGNPFLALIILLVILYFLDRRYVGILPSFTKPFRRSRQISKLRTTISLNPNDVSAKFDLARLLIERKRYSESKELLEQIADRYEQSAEYWVELGYANLKLGHLPEGEAQMLQGLEINRKAQYGQPYLRLAEVFRNIDHNKALQYVTQFQEIQSSSSEAYYLAGSMYKALGRKEDAKRAFNESTAVYRSLPKYKKRQERGWALRSYFAKMR